MKADVLDLQGKKKEQVSLPKVFSEPVRADLIKRAVISAQSNERQPYGPNWMSGKKTSAHYHGYRRHRYTMMNREMARMPRLHGKTVPFLNFRAKFVPHAMGGRAAHAPLPEKVWEQKINDKERQKAVRSAIAATAVRDLVEARGHRIGVLSVPIIVEDVFQNLKKTKDVASFLTSIGLDEEMERTSEKKVRAGRGKMRGRKYIKKVGPLFVIADDKGIGKAARNIPGVNVCRVGNLSAEYLAPGTKPGRLTIFTKSALEKLGE
jgi:large subunit ribosomal protein L4e